MMCTGVPLMRHPGVFLNVLRKQKQTLDRSVFLTYNWHELFCKEGDSLNGQLRL